MHSVSNKCLWTIFCFDYDDGYDDGDLRLFSLFLRILKYFLFVVVVAYLFTNIYKISFSADI